MDHQLTKDILPHLKKERYTSAARASGSTESTDADHALTTGSSLLSEMTL